MNSIGTPSAIRTSYEFVKIFCRERWYTRTVYKSYVIIIALPNIDVNRDDVYGKRNEDHDSFYYTYLNLNLLNSHLIYLHQYIVVRHSWKELVYNIVVYTLHNVYWLRVLYVCANI